MSYQPTDLQRGVTLITTPAAGTKVTQTPVGAPGVGKRLRVWAVYIACANTSLGPTAWYWADVMENASRRWIMSNSNGEQSMVYPPGGLAWGVNKSLEVGITSNAAGNCQWHVMVLYTIEAV